MPSARDEEWMRTDIRLLRLERFGLPTAVDVEESPVGALHRGVDLAGSVITLNSHTTSAELKPEWAAKGVLFGPIDRLVADHPDLVRCAERCAQSR